MFHSVNLAFCERLKTRIPYGFLGVFPTGQVNNHLKQTHDIVH